MMPGSLEYSNGATVDSSTSSHKKMWANGSSHDTNTPYIDTQCNASSSSAKLPDSTRSNGSRSASLATHPTLSPESLLVRQTTKAGRGVFAAVPLSAGTLIEVSHVLLFPAKEYNDHGRHTQLDNYTYVWSRASDGKTMALALGLGSLFNHSHSSTNTTYTLDRLSGTIRYRLTRDVVPGEELLISYGAGKMWWEKSASNGTGHVSSAEDDDDESDERLEDELFMLGQLGLDSEDKDVRHNKRREERRRFPHLQNNASSRSPLTPTSPTSTSPLIPSPKSVGPSAAPLWRITAAVDPSTTPLELMAVWAVDIDPRKSSNFMQFSRSISRRLRAAEGGGDGQEHMRQEDERSSQVDEDDDEMEDDDSGDEDDSMKHLRLFHRIGQGECLSALVCRVQDVPSMEKVAGLLETADVVIQGSKPRPFQVQVPKFPAPSRLRLPEWKAYWPVAVKHGKMVDTLTKSSLLGGIAISNQGNSTPGIVDRGADARLWTTESTQWAAQNFRKCLSLAKKAKERGELPVGVHVTPSYGDLDSNSIGPDGHPWIEVDAWDTRQSERNPIKHGVTNAIRDVAKLRSDRDRDRLMLLSAKVAAQSSEGQVDSNNISRVGAKAIDEATSAGRISNGQDYLLNNLTLFTTHEPCVSCCMALVHSRVRTIFFIKPSPGAGGCCGSGLDDGQRCSHAEDGGPYAIQEQAGLNHHFDVWKWVGDSKQLADEDLNQLLDIHGLDA